MIKYPNLYDLYLSFCKFRAFLVDFHCPLFRVALNTPTEAWELENNWENSCIAVDNK